MKNQDKKYKLLLIDIDGTLTHNLGVPPREFDASKYLYKTIKRGLKYIKIGLCTGRDKATVVKIANKLGLNSLHVIEGGARIIDNQGADIMTQYISPNSAQNLINFFKETKPPFSVVVNSIEIVNTAPKANLDKISAVIWFEQTEEEVHLLKQKLSQYKDVAVAVNIESNGRTVYVTHKLATKGHGVKKLIRFLRIKKEEVIGIGDGNNDKPLLLSCGLKVAMGNAIDELKGIADYVAPSVDQDGVAKVIEKFILKRNSNSFY